MCYSHFFDQIAMVKKGILFSTEVRAVVVVVVAKLVILGILLLNLFILALRAVLIVKLVISGILSSIFLILTLHKTFFNNIVFCYIG